MAEPVESPQRRALVTGCAGFIGHSVTKALLDAGWRVVGIDAMTDYYDPTLKKARLSTLSGRDGFDFVPGKIEDTDVLESLVNESRPEVIVHLAAQAGVRFSIDAPESYVQANIVGTFRVLEAARAHPPAHMLLASTSSAYGANSTFPYRETDKADTPLSFYAATKKATEAMAHSYAHLYDLPTTMFRFFTVYGPWSRPDMAPWKFTQAAFEGRTIDVYNHGQMARDFTFIDDLTEVLTRLIDAVPPHPTSGEVADKGDSLSPVAPFRVVNIGNSEPIELLDFIAAIELATGRQLNKRFLPMQPGDVHRTWADTRLAQKLTGYRSSTPVSKGVAAFVEWFRQYHGIG
ncbi:MAG: SDR family NAD(P)-dependent oxidoreductase [Pseudomonadota bacterium]